MRNRSSLLRRLGMLSTFAVTAAILSSCASSGASHHKSEGFWSRNLKGHVAVIRRDMTNFYETFDRHVFNYDWDDPTLDVD